MRKEEVPSPTPAVPTNLEVTTPDAPGFVPLTGVDRRFALTLFGMANGGIGLSVARIFSKRRKFHP